MIAYYGNGDGNSGSFIVHKTFLEPHSKTALQHSTIQLKWMGTCLKMSKKKWNPKSLRTAGPAWSRAWDPRLTSIKDVDTQPSPSTHLRQHDAFSSQPSSDSEGRLMKGCTKHLFRSLWDLLRLRRSSCMDMKNCFFNHVPICFSCFGQCCDTVLLLSSRNVLGNIKLQLTSIHMRVSR